MFLSAATSQADKGTADPVSAVSVVSTGTVEIHPEHAYGSTKSLYWWLLTSRAWLLPRPINVYVIEHAKGLVVFDTGQDRPRSPTTRIFPADSPESSTTDWPNSTSTRARHSTASSTRSGTRQPMSTRRSCPTSTRTTSAASSSSTAPS
jgi:hypothetical protein